MTKLAKFEAAIAPRLAKLRRAQPPRRDPWDPARVAARTAAVLRRGMPDLPAFLRPTRRQPDAPAPAPPAAPLRMAPVRTRGDYVRGGRIDALRRLTAGAGGAS